MAQTTHPIDVDRLVELAVEHWRLSTELTGSRSASVNRSLRKIGDFLAACEIETRVLDGQPYDPGLAARVIDSVDDPTVRGDAAVVIQTVCPMVLYRGNVLRATEIVVARKPG